MKILIINGPNLNMLGKRDASHYGHLTLPGINKLLRKKAMELAGERTIALHFFQSNSEGALIDFIQKEGERADGILINPGALTHYSYALRDTLADSGLPVVEVHLSNIMKRELWRRKSVIADIAVDRVMGLKEKSYVVGLERLVHQLSFPRPASPSESRREAGIQKK